MGLIQWRKFNIDLRWASDQKGNFQSDQNNNSCSGSGPELQEKMTLKERSTKFKQMQSFPLHFDETSLFGGDEKESAKLKEDIRLAFLNISRIMDCVGCFKCRLWGKLQTQGLGTALRILFSERQIEALPKSSNRQPSFQLSRQEIVSLFNAFGRISTSVRELKNFRVLLAEEQ